MRIVSSETVQEDSSHLGVGEGRGSPGRGGGAVDGRGVEPGKGSTEGNGVTNGGGQRNTSARIWSSVPNERMPVSPPALTIFLRKSLTELSLIEPMRMQPSAAVISVLSRT
jgi:hypothetical protein